MISWNWSLDASRYSCRDKATWDVDVWCGEFSNLNSLKFHNVLVSTWNGDVSRYRDSNNRYVLLSGFLSDYVEKLNQLRQRIWICTMNYSPTESRCILIPANAVLFSVNNEYDIYLSWKTRCILFCYTLRRIL